MTLDIFIPGTFPGLNDVIKTARGTRGRGSIMGAARQKAQHTERVAWQAILQCRKAFSFNKPVFVEFLWIEQSRRRDPDNIASAKKFILDGLVKAGVLVNDGWSQIAGFSDSWTVDKTKPGVQVTITEVGIWKTHQNHNREFGR